MRSGQVVIISVCCNILKQPSGCLTFSTSPAYNHFFIWNVIKTSYMNLEIPNDRNQHIRRDVDKKPRIKVKWSRGLWNQAIDKPWTWLLFIDLNVLNKQYHPNVGQFSWNKSVNMNKTNSFKRLVLEVLKKILRRIPPKKSYESTKRYAHAPKCVCVCESVCLCVVCLCVYQCVFFLPYQLPTQSFMCPTSQNAKSCQFCI